MNCEPFTKTNRTGEASSAASGAGEEAAARYGRQHLGGSARGRLACSHEPTQHLAILWANPPRVQPRTGGHLWDGGGRGGGGIARLHGIIHGGGNPKPVELGPPRRRGRLRSPHHPPPGLEICERGTPECWHTVHAYMISIREPRTYEPLSPIFPDLGLRCSPWPRR